MREGNTAFVQQPEAFRQFARGVHDDIGLEAETVADLARILLSGLTAEQRRDLRIYISHLTATLTPAEMKGVLNRVIADVKFSTKGSVELLRAAHEQLSAVT